MTEKIAAKSALSNRNRIRWLAKAGILTAVAVALMYLEMVLPLTPSFLKLDFSEIAVLLASFSMGPLTGILVELVKNLMHLPTSATGGIGELANFIVGSGFVGVAGLIYKYNKTRQGAFIAMGGGTLAMTVVGCLMNYFIMLPLYVVMFHFPIDAMVEMTQAAGNTLVTDKLSLILFVFVPFNIFKGVVVSLIVAMLYKRLSPLLHR